MDERGRIRLTKYSTKAGRASTFAPGDLEQALEGLAPESLGGFVSGTETRDDAGHVPLGGGLLLQTADFFTPVVDDPYRFGRVAAVDAFSDVYAMGGEPLTAPRRDLVSKGEIEDAVGSAATLNRAAGDAMREVGVSAATDVAGYGLLGHLLETLRRDEVSAAVIVEGASVRVTA